MSMRPKQFEKWTETRKMGRSRFIWLYGVLGWGLIAGVPWSVLMAFQQGWERLPYLFIAGITGFPIGGYFFAALIWKISEKKYTQAQEDRRQ